MRDSKETTCFISRLGGAGDVLHCAHLPRLIKEYYKVDRVDFETNYHGMHILKDNPHIDNLIYIDMHGLTFNRMSKHIQHCSEKYNLCFNFANTIEKEYCTNENDQRYYRSDKWRRENLGKISYYDVMTKAAGLPESYFGTRGHLYYSDEDHKKAKTWVVDTKQKHGSDFIVLVNLSGSTLQKKFIGVKDVCLKILDKIPTARIYLTGDEHCEAQVFEHERVISKIGKWNFRTAALFCKYFDLTLSLESGIALIAHSWDAPTLQLLTAASWDNHVKYAKNAHWMQSEVGCSPCHKNPREFFGCPIKYSHPACIYFNVDKVADKVVDIYEHR